MRRFKFILSVLFWVHIGLILGVAIYIRIDMRQRPILYLISSAPWYTPLIPLGAYVVIANLIILLILRNLRKKGF